MGRAADRAGIRLHGSKGAAVRATRGQTDRVLYKSAVATQDGLDFKEMASCPISNRAEDPRPL